jgi:D-glycero-D-manno-heptose 1,7-bisphosphate phosphatase
MTKLILLDRDGVINFNSPDYIKEPAEWLPLPGALEAIAKLRNAGYLVGVCSNQAGVGRAKFSNADLDAIHAKMCRAIADAGAELNSVHYCRHHPNEGCACRKPEPGMLLAAMQESQADPQQTLYIGDSITDVQAALAAGCQPILVRTGNGLDAARAAVAVANPPVYDDLAHFAREWLA